MKFNINDYPGKYAMHCKTEEEAKDFCNYMYRINGIMWGSLSNHPCYYIYKSNTTYNLHNGLYGHINNFINAGYTILEWSDFMNKEFTKACLKTGDIIQRRNGDIEIVNCEFETFISKDGWKSFEFIKEELTHERMKEFDIVAVRRPRRTGDCQFGAFEYKCGTLVYKREEPVEMTLAEVCKALGKEIKIVK